MKIKLLILIGMMVVPLLSSAQGTKPVFFNKGKMSVVGTDTTKTVLYVAGDFIASRDATDKTVKSEIHLKKSKTVLTGSFYQDGFNVDGVWNEKVFFLPSDAGEVSRLEFRGEEAQVISTNRSTTYTPAWKSENYVDFPVIAINNNKHVTMSPEIAAKVKGLDLYRGRLILDSRRLKSDEVPGLGTTIHDVSNSSLLAHLFVDESPSVMSYGRKVTTTLDDYGAVEVRVAMDESKTLTEDEEKKGRSIIGMGSPFKEIKTDYFMYNFLMFPYGNNILGYWNFTETRPTVSLSAGKGFVVGIDLRGTDPNDYIPFDKDPDYAGKISFADRVKDTYKFSRFAYNNKNNIYPLKGLKPSDNQFSEVEVTDATYANEQLVYGDVTMSLKTGFNYLANPYTTPLNLEQLLTEAAASANDWKTDIGNNGDILPYAWVLNPSSAASGKYNLTSGAELGEERLHATYTYFLLKSVGGTYNMETGDQENISAEGENFVIAPLQMFLVYGLKPDLTRTITIPASQRIGNSAANFLRSATGKSSTTKRDDFVFEVVDLTTKTYDRTAVVLRTPDEVLSTPTAYVDKTVSSVVPETSNNTLKSVTTTGTVSSTFNSVIYTLSPAGAALESKYLGLANGVGEVSTPLYLSPSTTAQKIAIKAKRLNTMDEVNEIWLDDKRDNKSFELSSGKDYETSVKPTDAHDRFTLRFVRSASGIGDETEVADKSITSYYADGVLTVSGFEQSDINSLISIYDIQGRMLKQVKVIDLTMRISEVFYPGAYIVKVSGNNKSYVSKFLVR